MPPGSTACSCKLRKDGKRPHQNRISATHNPKPGLATDRVCATQARAASIPNALMCSHHRRDRRAVTPAESTACRTRRSGARRPGRAPGLNPECRRGAQRRGGPGPPGMAMPRWPQTGSNGSAGSRAGAGGRLRGGPPQPSKDCRWLADQCY